MVVRDVLPYPIEEMGMKMKPVLAVFALMGVVAFAASSNAAPLGGTGLSTKSAAVDTSAVTKVHKRHRHYRHRYASNRKWRHRRYGAYRPYYYRPYYYRPYYYYDSPYYYSTSLYGYPFTYRYGYPYRRWNRGGVYIGYGW